MDFSAFPSANNLDYQNIILSNGISSFFLGWTDKRFSNPYFDSVKFIANDKFEEDYILDSEGNILTSYIKNKTYFPVYKDENLVFNLDADTSENISFNASYLSKAVKLDNFDAANINLKNAAVYDEDEISASSLFKGSIMLFEPSYSFNIIGYDDNDDPIFGELSAVGNILNYKVISNEDEFKKLSPINTDGYTEIFIGTIRNFNLVNGLSTGQVISNAKYRSNTDHTIIYSSLSTDTVTVQNDTTGRIAPSSGTGYPFNKIEIFQKTELLPLTIIRDVEVSLPFGGNNGPDQFIINDGYHIGSNSYQTEFIMAQSDDSHRMKFQNNPQLPILYDSLVDKTIFIARRLVSSKRSDGSYDCELKTYVKTIADDLSVVTETINVSASIMNPIMNRNNDSKNILIGCSPRSALTFFNGNIKRLSLFNRALSDTEIRNIATDFDELIDTSRLREVRYHKEETSGYLKSKIVNTENFVRIINAVKNYSYQSDNLTLNARGLATSSSRSSIAYPFPDTVKITNVTPGSSVLNYYIVMEKPRTVNFYNNSTLVKSIKIKDVSTSFTVPSEVENIENYQGLSRTSSTSSVDYPRGEAVSVTSGTSTLNYYIVTLRPRTINYIAKYGNHTTTFKTDTVLENVTSLTIPNDVKTHSISDYKLASISLSDQPLEVTGSQDIGEVETDTSDHAGDYAIKTITFNVNIENKINEIINEHTTIPNSLTITAGTTPINVYCHYLSLTEVDTILEINGSTLTSNDKWESIFYRLNPETDDEIYYVAGSLNSGLGISGRFADEISDLKAVSRRQDTYGNTYTYTVQNFIDSDDTVKTKRTFNYSSNPMTEYSYWKIMPGGSYRLSTSYAPPGEENYWKGYQFYWKHNYNCKVSNGTNKLYIVFASHNEHGIADYKLSVKKLKFKI